MSYNPNQPYEGQNQPPQPYTQPPTQYNPPITDYDQPTTDFSQPYDQPLQPPYAPPPYGSAPPVPNYTQPPRQKSSRRVLWITLAIIGGIALLVCGGCAIASLAGISLFGPAVTKALGPSTTANAYYQAIQKQDYTTAYTFLDTSSVSVQGQQITEDTFVILAQTVDKTKGTASGFHQTSVNVDTTAGTAAISMSVTRNGASYPVQIQLRQINNDWKITFVDNL